VRQALLVLAALGFGTAVAVVMLACTDRMLPGGRR